MTDLLAPDHANSRVAYIVSDSTGITAETFGHSVLSRFDGLQYKSVRVPYVDTLEKADELVERINRAAQETGLRPLVFSTLVTPVVLERVRQADAVFLDLFSSVLSTVETELGMKATHAIGRSHKVDDTQRYQQRIAAINFSLSHDDGQFVNQLGLADVILVGVSRCGKTPTSLYLAMQYAVKAANFPLTPDDFERGQLPKTIAPFRHKIFGLSIDPERLSQVRNERRPNSQYASLKQCLYEVAEGEAMMRRAGIAWLSTTTKSIEEIATTVLQEVGLER